MGKKSDAGACVDTDFRVRGVEDLRVADLSVLPIIPKYVPSCLSALLMILTVCLQQSHTVDGVSGWRNRS